MSVPFLTKYAPSSLHDIVFASPDAEKIINLYAKGYKSEHLMLWGAQGSGKSSIANLLPNIIEGVDFPIHKIHASAIKDFDELIAKIAGNRNHAPFAGGKFGRYYLVVEELAFSHESCSRFWTEIERIQKDSMVIITTNAPMKIDRSIRSRCEILEIQAASPAQFLPRAKWILEQEGFDASDDDVLRLLTEVAHHRDNRRYLMRLDTAVGNYRMEMDEAASLNAPLLEADHG